MGVTIEGDMTLNQVDAEPSWLNAIPFGHIRMRGSGNIVSIKTRRPFHHLMVHLDGGSSLSIEENVFCNTLDVHLTGASSASIGQNSFSIGKLRLYSHETATIRIGRDCLISDGILCMTSDMHTIIDIADNVRINPSGDIIVGDRVWLGPEAVLLRDTTIGDGSIVAIRSVVRGDIPSNCMMAGYPARLVKSNVTWAGDLRPTRPT